MAMGFSIIYHVQQHVTELADRIRKSNLVQPAGLPTQGDCILQSKHLFQVGITESGTKAFGLHTTFA